MKICAASRQKINRSISKETKKILKAKNDWLFSVKNWKDHISRLEGLQRCEFNQGTEDLLQELRMALEDKD